MASFILLSQTPVETDMSDPGMSLALSSTFTDTFAVSDGSLVLSE